MKRVSYKDLLLIAAVCMLVFFALHGKKTFQTQLAAPPDIPKALAVTDVDGKVGNAAITQLVDTQVNISAKDAAKMQLTDNDFRKSLNATMNKINFIPNKGQFHEEALYVFQTPQANMIIYKDRLRLVCKTGEIQQPVDIRFKDANKFSPEAIYGEDSPEYNWFTPEGNYTGIRSAAEVHLPKVYDGIDLRLYSNSEGSLEFDWIIKDPHDYKKIQMQLNGQDSLAIDAKGNLQIHIQKLSLALNIPETYQVNNDKREQKTAEFCVKDEMVSYCIADNLDTDKALVIDPKLAWGSFMDGSPNNTNFDSYLYGGTIDEEGNIYICGSSEGISKTDIETTAYGNPVPGYDDIADPQSSGDGTDWLIMKIKNDASKVLNYTFYGAAQGGEEKAYAISISPENNSIFVGGILYGAQPALSASYSHNTSFSAAISGFSIPGIAVFSSDLKQLKYRTLIGDNSGHFSNEGIKSIEALNDSSFIMGATISPILQPGLNGQSYTKNGIDVSHGGGDVDMYIARFNGYNQIDWGTFIGGNSRDQLYDMRLFPNGDIGFCGNSISRDSTITGWSGTGFINEVADITNRNNGSNYDAIVGVLKADGSSLKMLSKVGGSNTDQFTGLSIGPCNTMFLCGTSSSANFPNIGANVIQPRYAGSNDIILFRCSADGGITETSATYYGGTGNDQGNSIAYLPIGTGRLFVFNSSHGGLVTKNITGNTFFSASSQGGTDIFFIECSTDFKTTYLATYLGGPQNDYLGNTGAPVTGKQMVLLNDTLLCVFTTSHSSAFIPNIINTSNVFDNRKSSSINDSWILFALNFVNDISPTDAGDAPITHGRFTTGIYVDSTNKALLTLGHKIDDDKTYPRITNANADIDDINGFTEPRRAGNLIYYNPGITDTLSLANDEDALTSIITLDKTATTFSLDVPFYNNTRFTCTIYGYIDFNGDGDFDNVLERAQVDSLPANNALNRTARLTWDLTDCGIIRDGDVFIRLLILSNDSTENVLECGRYTSTINGGIGTGEVEDYPVKIRCISMDSAIASKTDATKCFLADGSITLSNLQLLPNTDYYIYYTRNNVQYGPVNYHVASNTSTITLQNMPGGDYTVIKIVSEDNPSCCYDSISLNVTINTQICPIEVPNTPVLVDQNDSTEICIPITDENISQVHTTQFCGLPQHGTIKDSVIINNNTSDPHTVCLEYVSDTSYIGNDTICLVTCNNLNPQLCDTHFVHIIIQVPVENIEDIVFIPNSFSPNGDGANDVFLVRSPDGVMLIEYMIIYDRWGNKVFERNNILPNDLSSGWDGTYKEKPVQDDAYAYYVGVKLLDGKQYILKGNVTLLR